MPRTMTVAEFQAMAASIPDDNPAAVIAVPDDSGSLPLVTDYAVQSDGGLSYTVVGYVNFQAGTYDAIET